jgi:FkbM family methyltransferase
MRDRFGSDIRRLAIPLARSYIRYAPFGLGKPWLWSEVIHPYLAWQSYPFVATTVFGAKIAGNTMDIIQQYLYYFGVWEPHLTRWITQKLQPGDTFIDVGANIGYFSLLASSLVGEAGAVVAIEASPRTFVLLENNLARNHVTNVRALNVAASNRHGVAQVFRGHASNIGLTTIIKDEDLPYECDVVTAPLGALLLPVESQNARVIKIDVEGAEWAVAASMVPLLRGSRADLEVIVEIDPGPLAKQGKCPGDVMKIFREAGFHAYRMANDYSPLSYLRPMAESRPIRLHSPPEQVTDVVFSRRDAEMLC